jgi:hypothetical protein
MCQGSEHDPSKNPFNTVNMGPGSHDPMAPRLPFPSPTSHPNVKPEPGKVGLTDASTWVNLSWG